MIKRRKKSDKKKEKDDEESQKDEKQDEEEKIVFPEKQETQTNTNSSQTKEPLLSTENTNIITPSDQKSDDKGFEVDEEGLLKITDFHDSLNIKLTNQLAELFQKISKRFKVSPKMDTSTYIKTLHNMYLQHYNKYFRETGEFNDETSAILFPQIMKFMWDRKFLQGRLLKLVIENNTFDIVEIDNFSKVTIDWDGLLKISKQYSLTTESEGTTVSDKKINLQLEDKVKITLIITEKLISNLIKSVTGLPKNKSSMLKKIGSIIRMWATSKEMNADYKQTLDRNKRVRFWCLDLLQEK